MSSWYSEAVDYMIENGIMNGTSESEFEPDSSMTRGQLVTVLWRNDGSESVGEASAFTDVDPAEWYGPAVIWASQNGIVNGVGDGKFNPDGYVTREQIAAIFMRYAAYKDVGISVSPSGLDSFNDFESVSGYAVSAMKWAVGATLINGDSGSLNPAANATRAQVATILYRFISTVMNDKDEGTTENEPAFFYHGNTVSKPGDVVTVTGEYFNIFTEALVNGVKMPIVASDRNYVMFQIPDDAELGVYNVVLSGGGVKRHVKVNEPKVVWVQGDEGEFATPGGWLRVNGECLSIDGSGCLIDLIAEDGSALHLGATDVKDQCSVEIALPEDLPLGTYRLRYSNGYASSELTEVKIDEAVRDSWPTDVFNIMDYGAVRDNSAADNYDALKAALKAAEDNGGGVVYFPKGFYQMGAAKSALTIPAKTVIRGEGMNLTSVHWGSFELGGSGWTLDSMPKSIFKTTKDGCVAFEDMTFTGALMPKFLDTYNAYNNPRDYMKYVNNVYVNRCRIYSNMYAANDGFPKDQETTPVYDKNKVEQYIVDNPMFDMKCQNFQVTDCEFQWDSMIIGRGYNTSLGYNKNILFSGNKIIGASIDTLYDGGIVEDNTILGGTKGMFVFGINGERVYFARNYLLEGADSVDREVMSSDWNAVGRFHGQVTFDDDTHITFPEDEMGDTMNGITPDMNAYFRHRLCVLIVNGTGVGQYRYVTERDGLTVTLESPFDVYDETSEFMLTRMNAHWLIVNNFFGYTGACQFYVGQMDSVVMGNESYFSSGIDSTSVELYGGYQCHWNITYDSNYIHGGVYQHTFQTWPSRIMLNINSPVTANIANNIKSNIFEDYSQIQYGCNRAEAGFGLTLQNNSFENAGTAIYCWGAASPMGTVFSRNEFSGCYTDISYPADRSQIIEIN